MIITTKSGGMGIGVVVGISREATYSHDHANSPNSLINWCKCRTSMDERGIGIRDRIFEEKNLIYPAPSPGLRAYVVGYRRDALRRSRRRRARTGRALGQGVCLGLRGNVRTVIVHTGTVTRQMPTRRDAVADGDPGAIIGRAGASRSPVTIVQLRWRRFDRRTRSFWPPFSWICAKYIVHKQPHMRAVQEKGRER